MIAPFKTFVLSPGLESLADPQRAPTYDHFISTQRWESLKRVRLDLSGCSLPPCFEFFEGSPSIEELVIDDSFASKSFPPSVFTRSTVLPNLRLFIADVKWSSEILLASDGKAYHHNLESWSCGDARWSDDGSCLLQILAVLPSLRRLEIEQIDLMGDLVELASVASRLQWLDVVSVHAGICDYGAGICLSARRLPERLLVSVLPLTGNLLPNEHILPNDRMR